MVNFQATFINLVSVATFVKSDSENFLIFADHTTSVNYLNCNGKTRASICLQSNATGSVWLRDAVEVVIGRRWGPVSRAAIN